MYEGLSVVEPIDFNKTRTRIESELGWRITGPFYSFVPTPKSEYAEKCKVEIQKLIHQLLETVIIEDIFNKDNLARKNFEEKNPTVDEFCSKHSKLKIKNLLGCLLNMKRIIKTVDRTSPSLAQKLEDIAKLEIIGKEYESYKYSQLEFPEKVTLARKLDDVVYQFLLTLFQQLKA